MKRILISTLGVAALALSAMAGVSLTNAAPGQEASQYAEQARMQTFAIENMTCAACPITVRTAMKRVAGVKSVDVDFKAKTATVAFDPDVATAEQIAAASTNAGYPATNLQD